MSFIGVDGGGTKTEFVRCDASGRVLAHCLLPTSNPADIGLTAAYRVLQRGIRALFSGTDGQIDGMFVGLSGGTTGHFQEDIHKLLTADFPKVRFANGSDAQNAISMGLQEQDGVILIAGTGSVCFAQTGAALRRVGGWGYLFDGAGSGYDLGRSAVSAALCAGDGRGEKTMLTQLLKNALGCDVPSALDRLYRGGKRYIAGFAPLVFDAAAQGDGVALAILEQTVSYWVRLIRTASQGMPPTIEVALFGSLFKQTELAADPLKCALGDGFHLTVPQNPPVFGALREAMKLAGLSPGKDVSANFAKTIKEVKTVELSLED